MDSQAELNKKKAEFLKSKEIDMDEIIENLTKKIRNIPLEKYQTYIELMGENDEYMSSIQKYEKRIKLVGKDKSSLYESTHKKIFSSKASHDMNEGSTLEERKQNDHITEIKEEDQTYDGSNLIEKEAIINENQENNNKEEEEVQEILENELIEEVIKDKEELILENDKDIDSKHEDNTVKKPEEDNKEVQESDLKEEIKKEEDMDKAEEKEVKSEIEIVNNEGKFKLPSDMNNINPTEKESMQEEERPPKTSIPIDLGFLQEKDPTITKPLNLFNKKAKANSPKGLDFSVLNLERKYEEAKSEILKEEPEEDKKENNEDIELNIKSKRVRNIVKRKSNDASYNPFGAED